MQIIYIASIVDIALFSIAAILTCFRIKQSHQFQNYAFLYLFHAQIIIICLLEISIGAINIIVSSFNLRIFYEQEIINNMSLIIQMALILTISYGWRVTTTKLKDQYIPMKHYIEKLKFGYLISVKMLFLMYILSTGATIFLFVQYGNQNRLIQCIISINELVIYCCIIIATFIQLKEGRGLSKIINQFRVLISIEMHKFRFNLIYIVAFLLNLLRSIVEIGRISYYFPISTNLIVHQNLLYFISYEIFQILPIFLYLFGISIKKNPAQKQQILYRQSNESSATQRSSKKETQMIKNISKTIQA